MAGFQAPKGTYDVLPGSGFLGVRDGLLAPSQLAGYGYLEAPVFEDTELFARGVGASTDVVTKEMYTFEDRGGRSLTLRPEGTAGVVRTVLEHGLQNGRLPVKVRYAGPMFRAERPQAGRFRQFQQVGIEALGSSDPMLDAEVIALAWQGFSGLGLTDVRLLLTSLGDASCRPAYRDELMAFLAGLELDEATRARAEINPLRVLDDKRPEVQAQLESAPLISDRLCAECKAHHDEVVDSLHALGVPFEPAPRLVRGLDYYMRTTFEFVHDGLGAQSAVGGGGRYDGLSELIGGPALPGIGWALGIERTLLALTAEGLALPAERGLEVFVVPLGATAKAWALTTVAELRAAGVAADMVFGERGMKGSMKAADRSGARWAVVVGDRDLEAGVAQLKDLTNGEQIAVPLPDLPEKISAELLEKLA
jgi:histidyl-tRNA synthetase